jgi:hypothetical protein
VLLMWRTVPNGKLWRYYAAAMAITVKLQDVVEALDMLGDEMSAYLNKSTGELITLTEEEFDAAEEMAGGDEDVLEDESLAENDLDQGLEENDLDEGLEEIDPDGKRGLADYPEWQHESILKAREIIGSDDWVELPTKADIHEWEIMEKFGQSIEDPKISESLLRAIRGSGAFGRFRRALDVLDLREVWFDFRAGEVERIAVEWLEDNEIEYSKELTAGKAS